MNIKTKNTGTTPVINYLLIAFSIILTINAIIFGYPFHMLLPFIKALLLIFGIFIYGFFLLNLIKSFCGGSRGAVFSKGAPLVVEGKIKFDAAFAVGLIFTTFFFYSAAFLKLLSLPVILIFYLFPLLLLFLIIKKRKTVLMETLGSFLKRPVYEYLIFLFPLIYASLPSSFYDALVFHLGIPNLYLQHSGFIATPQFLYGNFSIYYEILLIPSVFAGDLVPRLFHFFIGVILIFSVIDFSVEFFNLKKRNIFALTIISIPLTVFLVSTVKSDLPAAFFIFLGIKYFFKSRPTGGVYSHPPDFFRDETIFTEFARAFGNKKNVFFRSRIFFSAVMWGFSIGIKYTNIIPLIIFLLIMCVKEKSFNTKKIVIFAITIFLILLPLFIKNYTFAHNPFYPFFYETFKTDSWDSGRHVEMKKDSGGIFNSFNDFLKFPYTLSFGEVGIGGIPGPIFLIFLPFLLVRREKNNFLLIFSLLLLFIGPLFKASIRCWYAAFLFLTIYVVRVYESETKKILKYLFFMVISLNFLTAFAFQERAYKSHYLFSGKFNMEEYKAFLFPTYPAFSYLNRSTPKESKTLIIGESRNYYLKKPYQVASPYDYSLLKKYLNRSQSKEQLTASLKKDGIRYIVYNSKEFARLQNDYKRMSEAELRKFNLFIKTLAPLFNEKGVYVFEMD